MKRKERSQERKQYSNEEVKTFIDKCKFAYSTVETKDSLTNTPEHITRFLEQILSSLPKVLSKIISDYSSPCKPVYLSHKKWSSVISVDNFVTYSGYRPTIVHDGTADHWSEAIFEGYTDKEFAELVFPDLRFELLEGSSIYLPASDGYIEKKEGMYFVYVLENIHSGNKEKWIYVTENRGWYIGGTFYYNWVVKQKLVAKLLTPKWICKECGKENQRLRHQCWPCGKLRLETDSQYLEKWNQFLSTSGETKIFVCKSTNPYYATFTTYFEEDFFFVINPPKGLFLNYCVRCFNEATIACECKQVSYCSQQCKQRYRCHHYKKEKTFCLGCEILILKKEENSISCWVCNRNWCSSKCWELTSSSHTVRCWSTTPIPFEPPDLYVSMAL
jgi:hypothetical protein